MLRLYRQLFRRVFARFFPPRVTNRLPPARRRRVPLAVGQLEDRSLPGSVADVLVAAVLGGVASEPIVAVAGALGEQAFAGAVGEGGGEPVSLTSPVFDSVDLNSPPLPSLLSEAATETGSTPPAGSVASDPPTPFDPFDDLIPNGVGVDIYTSTATNPFSHDGGFPSQPEEGGGSLTTPVSDLDSSPSQPASESTTGLSLANLGGTLPTIPLPTLASKESSQSAGPLAGDASVSTPLGDAPAFTARSAVPESDPTADPFPWAGDPTDPGFIPEPAAFSVQADTPTEPPSGLPRFLVVAADPTASEVGASTGVFRITRVGPADAEQTVYFTLEGSAKSGVDYETEYNSDKLLKEATFAPGQRALAVTITPTANGTVDPERTVDLTIVPSLTGDYAVDSMSKATVRIAADAGDPAPPSGTPTAGNPVVWVRTADATASEFGKGTAGFEVFRREAGDDYAKALRVYYRAVTDNSADNPLATEGTDYSFAVKSVLISAGQKSAALVVNPTDDTLLEGTETVRVELVATPPGGTVGDFVWQDGNRNGIQDSGESGFGGVTVALYSVGDGGKLFFQAKTTTDYLGKYSFADVLPGEYAVRVVAPDGYGFSPQSAGNAATDSDADSSGQTSVFTVESGLSLDGIDIGLMSTSSPQVLLYTQSGGSYEGSTGSVLVQRSGGDLSSPLAVDLDLGAVPGYPTATLGTDYTLSVGGVPVAVTNGRFQVTIPAGQTGVSVVVSAATDALPEGNEGVRFAVVPSDRYWVTGPIPEIGGYGWAASNFIVFDSSPQVLLYTQSGGSYEGSTGSVLVQRSGGDLSSPLAVDLDLGAVPGYPTATLGTDYTLSVGGVPVAVTNGRFQVTIPAGQTGVSVVVSAATDALPEGNEGVRFAVVPSDRYWVTGPIPEIGGYGWAASNFIVYDKEQGTASSTGPAVSLVYGTGGVTEGQSSSFSVHRSGGDLSAPLDVTLTVTAAGADYGVDYRFYRTGGTESPIALGAGTTFTVTIPAGQTNVPVSVRGIADGLIEGFERASVSINGSSSYALGGPSVTDLWVSDVPPAVSLTPGTTSVSEGGSSSFTVYRNGGDLATPLDVTLQASPSPLRAGADASDYVLLVGGTPLTPDADGKYHVTIPANQTSLAVTFSAKTDSEVEPTEGLWLQVIAGSGYQLGGPAAAEWLIRDVPNGAPASTKYQVVGTSTVATILDDDSKLVFSNTAITPGSPVAADEFVATGPVTLATFRDADPLRTADDYEVTVSWGDGTPLDTEGDVEVTPDGAGGFQVVGDHTYEKAGWFVVTVTVTAVYRQDPADPYSQVLFRRSATTRVTAVVSPPEVTVEPVNFLTGVKCVPVTPLSTGGVEVARFVPDENIVDPVARYSAVVYAGDGTGGVPARIEADPLFPGQYRIVTPTLRYNAAGTYELFVLVLDRSPGLKPDGERVGNTRVRIDVTDPAEAGPTTVEVAPVSDAVEGQTVGGKAIAQITIPGQSVPLGSVSVRIDWGDGTPAVNGVVEFVPGFAGGTRFIVRTPNHVYVAPGSYGVEVRVTVGANPVVIRGTTITVRDAQVELTSAGLQLPAASGAVVGVAVGTPHFRLAELTTADPEDTGSQYTAWVAWGDGTGGAATVRGSGGQLWVEGTHAYASTGKYRAAVFLQNVNLGNGRVGADADAWFHEVDVEVVDLPEGGEYRPNYSRHESWGGWNWPVGVLRVESAGDTSDLRAWVDWWGDGSQPQQAILTSLGSVEPQLGEDGYTGTATYYDVAVDARSSESTYRWVSAFDGFTDAKTYTPEAGAVASGSGGKLTWDVTASDAPFQRPNGWVDPTPVVDPGQALTLPAVLEFLDPDPDAIDVDPAERYAAVIDWGDGTADDVGEFAVGEVGRFQVIAPSHTYTKAGTYTVTVFVRGLELTAGPDADPNATLLSGFTVVVGSGATPATPPDTLATWQIWAGQRRDERDASTWVSAGPSGQVSTNTGAVRIAHELDFDRSPGTSVGLDPTLVYNSSTVSPRPVIEARFGTGGAAVAAVRAVLTWAGQDQAPVTFTAAGASDVWGIAVRPDAAQATGVYDWKLTLTPLDPAGNPVTDGSGNPVSMVSTGVAQVVSNDASPFGAGWMLDDLWRLVPNADGKGGALIAYGTGESRYFPKQGLGFASPAEDFGTLRGFCDGFVYRDRYGTEWRFTPAGRLFEIVDRHGLKSSFAYDGTGRLSGFTAVDGNTVGVRYNALVQNKRYAVVFDESGGRTVRLSRTAGAVTILDPDDTTRVLSNDPSGRVTTDAWGTRRASYLYDPATGLATGFREGTNSSFTVASVAAAGLWGNGPARAPAPVSKGTVTDPRGNATASALDLLGRSLTTVFADATTAQSFRNAAGQVIRFVDQRNYATSYGYDGRGNLVSIAYPDGSGRAFAYDPVFSQVTRQTNGYGATTTSVLNATGDVVLVTDPLGNQTGYTYYDGKLAGLVKSLTDARDHTDSFQYDPETRRLTVSIDAKTQTTSYGYDGFGNPSTITQGSLPNNSTATAYDVMNRLQASFDAYGVRVGAWTYNPQGQVTLATDARGMKTESTYDPRGLTKSVTEGLGSPYARTTSFGYDSAGNRTSVTRPRDYDNSFTLGGGFFASEPRTETTKTAYDKMNRPIRVTEGFGTTSSRTTYHTYDDAGNRTVTRSSQLYDAALDEIDGLGLPLTPYWVRSRAEYDAMNRVTEFTDGINPGSAARVTRTAFDADGRVATTTDPLGRVTVSGRDPLGRVVSLTEAANTALARTTLTAYDPVGNVSFTTDPLGRVTRYTYDARDQMETMVEAAGTPVQRTTRYGYDARGNREFVHAPRWHDGELDGLKAKYPSLYKNEVAFVTTKYEYDANDRLKAVTEGANLAQGVWVPTASADMTVLLPHDRPVTSYQYNVAGDVIAVTDALGRTTRTFYDLFGRREAEFLNVRTGDQSARATLWTYDAADNVRSERTADARTTPITGETVRDLFNFVLRVDNSYQYDLFDRVTTATMAASSSGFEPLLSGPPVTRYEYDAHDNVTKEIDPRGTQTRYEYTALDQVKTETLAFGTDDARTATYEYDRVGRMTASIVTGYDPVAKLTRSLRTDSVFDALGRQIRVTTTPSAGFGTVRVTRSTYDAADNLLTATDPLNRRTAYQYDALDRVVRVTDAAHSAAYARTSAVGYDAADRVVWQATPRKYDAELGVVTNYLSQSAANVVITRTAYDGLGRAALTIEAANATVAELGHAPPITRVKSDILGRTEYSLSPVRDAAPGRAHAVHVSYNRYDGATSTEEGTWAFAGGAVALPGFFTPLRTDTADYDWAGNLTKEVTGVSNTPDLFSRPRWTDHRYDALGRVAVTQEHIDNAENIRATIRRYDPNGNVLQVVVQNLNSTGDMQVRSTGFEYDYLNRVTKTSAAAAVDPAAFVNIGVAPRATPAGDPTFAGYETSTLDTLAVYDGFDNVVKTTDPRGVSSVATYDAYGSKVSFTAASDWNKADPTISPLFHASPTTTWDYDAAGQLRSVVDPVGARTEFVYDPLGRLSKATEAVGAPEERYSTTRYDAADNPLRVTTNASTKAPVVVGGKSFVYNRPTVTGYEYDPLGRIHKAVDAPDLSDATILATFGHTRPWTETDYDAVGNPVRVRQNVSNSGSDLVTVARVGYDDLFRRVRATSGESDSGSLSVIGDTSVVRDVRSTYDSVDNVITVRDSSGVLTAFNYDLIGRKTQTIVGADQAANQLVTTLGYNTFDQMTREETPAKSMSKGYEYDRAGRMTATILHPQWQRIDYRYDKAGNQTKATETIHPTWFVAPSETPTGPTAKDFRQDITTTSFDALGRPVSVANPADQFSGFATTYRYDALGRVDFVLEPETNGKYYGRLFEYDKLGRRVIEHWIARTGYTASGTAKDEVTNAIRTVYDSADHVVYSFEATDDSRQVQVANAGTASVRVTAVAPETWETAQTTWILRAYDRLGRLRTADSATIYGGVLTYTSDAAGRVVRVEDPDGGTTAYGFDLAGRPTGETLANAAGKATTFTFGYKAAADAKTDQVGRLDLIETVTGWAAAVPTGMAAVIGSFRYDAFGREVYRGWRTPPTEAALNGEREQFQTEYGTDPLVNLGLVTVEKRNGALFSSEEKYAFANRDFKYDYGPRGQIIKTTVTTPGSPGEVVVPSEKDATGNAPYPSITDALSTARAYRPLQLGKYRATYDTAGRVVTMTDNPPADRSQEVRQWRFTYDARGRLVRVVEGRVKWKSDGSAVLAGTWRSLVRTDLDYDLEDNLVWRKVTYLVAGNYANDEYGNPLPRAAGQTVTHRYAFDRGRLYADHTVSGAPWTLRYLFGPNGAPLARLDAGGPLFYLADRRGSVAGIVNPAGDVAKRVRYENTAVAERVGAVTDRLEVGGVPYEYAVQMSVFGSRWMDPGLGRFTTPDGGGPGFSPYPVANNSVPNVEGSSWWSTTWAGMVVNDVRAYNAAIWQGPEYSGASWAEQFWDNAGRAYNASYTFRGAVEIAALPITFVEGIRADVRGYQSKNYSRGASVGWAIANNLPLSGAGMRLGEAIEGQSLSGADLGRKLSTGERWLAVGLAAIDLFPFGKAARTGWTAVRATARGGMSLTTASGRAVARELPGRILAAAGRAAADASVSRWGGAAARWVANLGPEARVGARWAERNLPGLNNVLDDVIHGGLGRVNTRLHDNAARAAERLGFKACFDAGSPIATRDGDKPIEDVKDYETYGDECDWTISRNEHDPDGPLVWRRVLRKFVRQSLVTDIYVQGRRFGTTFEHPFFPRHRNEWTAAGELKVGDELRLMSPGWLPIEKIVETGDVRTVYNLEVEDDHTYFVGCDEWGFIVWAHNTYLDPNTGQLATARRNSQIAKEVETQLIGIGLSKTEARQLSRAGAAEGMNGQGLVDAINRGDLAARHLATGGQGGFAYGIERILPEFDGVTTHSILITNEGRVIPFQSGNASTRYRYSSIGHTEAEASIWIRENGSRGGTIYHNNTNGTCSFCHAHIETLLPENAVLNVFPPRNAVPNNPWAHAEPTHYVGNASLPKMNP